MTNNSNHLYDYGKSMYGGWYANIMLDGMYTGIHTETLKELKLKLAELGFEVKNATRRDN